MLKGFFYRHRAGRATGLGVGVEGLAFERPSTLPRSGAIGGDRYQVRGSVGPLAGGAVKDTRGVTAIGLKGNGSAIQGTFELARLATLANGRG